MNWGTSETKYEAQRWYGTMDNNWGKSGAVDKIMDS